MTRTVCLLSAAAMLLALPQGVCSGADVAAGVDVNSAYVWRGMTLNDGLVIQPSVILSKEGFEAFLWGNINIGDYDNTLETDELSEIDIDVSYGRKLIGLDVRIGVVQYSYPNDGSLISTNGMAEAEPGTAEVYASLGLGITESISLGLDAYYDFDEIKDGYGKLSLSYEKMFDNSLVLTTGASLGIIGRDASETGEDGLHEYEVFAKAGYVTAGGIGITGTIAFTDTADKDVMPEQDTDVYGGVSLKYFF